MNRATDTSLWSSISVGTGWCRRIVEAGRRFTNERSGEVVRLQRRLDVGPQRQVIAARSIEVETARRAAPLLPRQVLPIRVHGAVRQEPHSGERVKGHQIVLAELGLAAFRGTVVRNPETFPGIWERAGGRSTASPACDSSEASSLTLISNGSAPFRGPSTNGPLEPVLPRTFVSSTFDRSVASSHFDASGPGSTRVLLCRAVPVSRLFMTYLKMRAMNRQYLKRKQTCWMSQGR